MDQTLRTMVEHLPHIMLLAVGGFLLATLLTPIYTFFAYRYKFWKKQRTTSTTGEKLSVFNKLHADKFKRNIPTMAGMVFLVSIIIITVLFNLDRGQTYLPLAALIGGGVVGLLDDIINLRSNGKGTAGLRSSIKFAMIAFLGLYLGWFFFYKLGVQSIYVPFIGDWTIGWRIIPLFAFAVVATAWLKWQLKGDKQAAKMFAGATPELSKNPEWTVEKKNIP